jgi:hypothetical protein
MTDALTEDLSDVTLVAKIASLKREIAMRERVYPGWVRAGRMKQDAADREIRIMRAILKDMLIIRAQAAEPELAL